MSDLNQTDPVVRGLVARVADMCMQGDPESALPYATDAANAAEQGMLRRGDVDARETYADVLFALGVSFRQADYAEGASLFLDDCLKVREELDAELKTPKSKDAVADTCYQLGLNGDQLSLFRSLSMREELADELSTIESRLELAEAYLGVSELGGTMLYASDAEMYLYRYFEELANIALDYNTPEYSQWFREQTQQGVYGVMREAPDKVYANRLAQRYLTIRANVVVQTGDAAEWKQFLEDASSLVDKQVLSVGTTARESLIDWYVKTAKEMVAGSIPLWAADDFLESLRSVGKLANHLAVEDSALRMSEACVTLANHVARERREAQSAELLKTALLEHKGLCSLYGSDSYYDILRTICLMRFDDPSYFEMTVVLADLLSKESGEECAWLKLRMSDFAFSMRGDKASSDRLRAALDSCTAVLSGSKERQLVLNDETRNRMLLFLGASNRYASAYDPRQAAAAFMDVTIDAVRIFVSSLSDRSYSSNVLLPNYLNMRSRYALAATDNATWQKFSSDATLLLKDASRGYQGSVPDSEAMLLWSRDMFSHMDSDEAPIICLQACAVLFATFSLFSDPKGDAAKEYYGMQVRLRERLANKSNTQEAANAFKNALLVVSSYDGGREAAYEKCVEMGDEYVRGAGKPATADALADACVSLAGTIRSDAAVVDLIWMNLSLRTRIASEASSEQSEVRLREAVDLCGDALEKLVGCHNLGIKTRQADDEELRFVQYLDLLHQALREQDVRNLSLEFSDKAYPRVQTIAVNLRDRRLASKVVSHYLAIEGAILQEDSSDERAWRRLSHDVIALYEQLAEYGGSQAKEALEWCREMHQRIMDDEDGETPLPGIQEVATVFARLAGMAKEDHDDSVVAECLDMEQDIIKKGVDALSDDSERDEFVLDMLKTNLRYVTLEEACSILEALGSRGTADSRAIAEPLISSTIAAGRNLSAQCHLFRRGDVGKKLDACLLLTRGHNALAKMSAQCKSTVAQTVLDSSLSEVEHELGRLYWSLSMDDVSHIKSARELWIACIENGAHSLPDDASLKTAAWYVATLSKIQHDLRDFVTVEPYKLHAEAVKVTVRVYRQYQKIASRYNTLGIWANYMDILNCAQQVIDMRGDHYFRKEAGQVEKEIRTVEKTIESLKAQR